MGIHRMEENEENNEELAMQMEAIGKAVQDAILEIKEKTKQPPIFEAILLGPMAIVVNMIVQNNLNEKMVMAFLAQNILGGVQTLREVIKTDNDKVTLDPKLAKLLNLPLNGQPN